MTPVQRRRLLALALLGTLARAGWVAYTSDLHEVDEVVQPLGKLPNSAPKISHQVEEQKLDSMGAHLERRAPFAAGEPNPFGPKSWYTPPPVVAVTPAPPPPPVAPQMPYTYVGKMVDEGKVHFYLAKGEQMYTVSAGDTLDDVYRFEGVENGNIVITYLPLAIKHLISIGTES